MQEFVIAEGNVDEVAELMRHWVNTKLSTNGTIRGYDPDEPVLWSSLEYHEISVVRVDGEFAIWMRTEKGDFGIHSTFGHKAVFVFHPESVTIDFLGPYGRIHYVLTVWKPPAA